jgi:hypothetical protein
MLQDHFGVPEMGPVARVQHIWVFKDKGERQVQHIIDRLSTPSLYGIQLLKAMTAAAQKEVRRHSMSALQAPCKVLVLLLSYTCTSGHELPHLSSQVAVAPSEIY